MLLMQHFFIYRKYTNLMGGYVHPFTMGCHSFNEHSKVPGYSNDWNGFQRIVVYSMSAITSSLFTVFMATFPLILLHNKSESEKSK